MKIYIGSAVQNLGASEYSIMIARIVWLKRELTKRGHEVLNYKSMADRESTPAEIFDHDYANCMNCDAFIALALNPSIGLGMEIVYCLTRRLQDRTPAFVYATAPENSNVSKLLLGCKEHSFAFEYFRQFEEVPDRFETAYQNYAIR
jgi:hypothetical protein